MTTQLEELIPELKQLVEDKCRAGHVPGATVAVGFGDEVIEVAAGVLNLNTGVETTPDSLFQIGSITKTFTATLVMQLVDEGLVELDAPVRKYVPEFSVSDEAATETVTVRQLLCHTCGFDGDVFDEFGRGEEAIARYVEDLKRRRQLYPPGRLFSYCNSGYSVLGRLVERVRDLPSWHEALHKHLLGPAGLKHMASLPEEALLFRTASGHVDDGDGPAQRVASRWCMAFANAPAGSFLSGSARDLVSYARLHMRGGVAADGTRVLSAESTAAMRELQFQLPPLGSAEPDGWGLGWMLFDFEGRRVYGHDGGTIGQYSMLRFVPERELSLAVLTNGGAPSELFHALQKLLLGRIAGITVPPMPTPPQPGIEIDKRRFLGRYETVGMYFDVAETPDGALQMESGQHGTPPEVGLDDKPRTFEVVGFTPSSLIQAEPMDGSHSTYGFPEVGEDGRAPYLYAGLRIALRVDGGRTEG